ncbi:hypothetical protein OUZ56_010473 [Daphnia magna]|uniref:Uncharacterized protein n=1 Tax=Daphnia magna TaxID=35525 RepID=A0ABR0AIM2_9CRUS|nr:hypothetical protein OUZ56_010473 [Daphnia magna]
MIQPVKPDWTTGKILIAKRRGRGIVWAADCPENEYVISKVMEKEICLKRNRLISRYGWECQVWLDKFNQIFHYVRGLLHQRNNISQEFFDGDESGNKTPTRDYFGGLTWDFS